MQFCNDFLDLVRRSMGTIDDAGIVYRFEYDRNVSDLVRLTKDGNEDLTFLPGWYVDWWRTTVATRDH